MKFDFNEPIIYKYAKLAFIASVWEEH